MTYNNWVYIAVMAAVSYAIRVLPLTLIRKPIKNQFIQKILPDSLSAYFRFHTLPDLAA